MPLRQSHQNEAPFHLLQDPDVSFLRVWPPVASVSYHSGEEPVGKKIKNMSKITNKKLILVTNAVLVCATVNMAVCEVRDHEFDAYW